MGIEDDDDLTMGLADAIRDISALISSGAVCADIASAAAQCAVSMLPRSQSMVMEILEDRQSARVLAAANAPFVVVGQEVPLTKNCVLNVALDEPFRVHVESDGGSNQWLLSRKSFPGATNDAIACKAVPRTDSQSIVLTLISNPETTARANAILMTLSELLIALCAGHDATVLHTKSLIDIARAKNEWEKTVDALPEVVCLVDQNGHIIRSNRTVERWGLADVCDVRGLHIHDLLHDKCTLSNCPLKDAVSLSMAKQASNAYLESAITDDILGKTLIVHTRLMPERSSGDNEQAHPCAVVVVSDISALQAAQRDLADLNQDLEKRVEFRTAELVKSNREINAEVGRRRAAEAELQASRDELADLTQQLIDAQEDERHRLSRELHDSLGQSLGAIKYSLERIVVMHETAALVKPEKEIATIIERVGYLIREARSMAMGLRPPMLDDMGAVSAVGWLCHTISETFTGIDFRIELEVSDDEIPKRLSTSIYRIAQEAMNNVVKHASAKSVLISLKIENNTLHLEVLDDGVGFENDASDTAYFEKLGKIGRLGMRERAINSNGSLTVESWPGEGTSVRAEWLLGDA